MAQDIKIKRSSVPGKSPEVSALQLGELATNTYDGKLFIKKNISGEESIVSIGDLVNDLNPTLSADLDLNVYNITGSGSTINLSGELDRATIQWNDIAQTYNISMGDGVIQQVGEEIYYPLVKNTTGATIYNGTPVWIVGVSDDHLSIAPNKADGSLNQLHYIGLATHDIEDNSLGRITYFGQLHDLDTSAWSTGDMLYVSAVSADKLTNIRPSSPNQAINVGFVTHSHATSGSIFIRYRVFSNAVDVTYDNNNSSLISTNVQSAIDELDLKKADLNTIAANINLYSTITSAGVDGYYKAVTETTDPAYPVSAIDVNTGAITGTDQYIAGLVADAGLFVGNPGVINITTLGSIRKTVGNSNSYAEFFFRLYKRTSLGVETLIGQSNSTGPVNFTLNQYDQFSAYSLLNDGIWLDTDRLVIKYYANNLGNGSPEYQFRFGGLEPVRTLLPVPISVIPTPPASAIYVDTSNFDDILNETDYTVQKALETLDNHTHSYISSLNGVQTIYSSDIEPILPKLSDIWIDSTSNTLKRWNSVSWVSLSISGYSGYSGQQGLSGYSGYSGQQGLSGLSGYSGQQGISGYSGQQGISGYSGNPIYISYIRKTSNYNAINGDRIVADTTSGSFTIYLPSTPLLGNTITLVDGGNWNANNLYINPNGSTIEGISDTLNINISGVYIDIVYDGTTWKVFANVTASDVPNQEGYSGYFLTTNGISASWAPAGVSITNDISSDTTQYLNMSREVSGTMTESYVSSSKLFFNPNTGILNSTDYNSLSDQNYKENIQTIKDGLTIINKLNPVSFNWKDTGQLSFGLIAQQVEEILPTLVDETNNVKSIAYLQVIAFLISAVQQQQAMIDEIKAKL